MTEQSRGRWGLGMAVTLAMAMAGGEARAQETPEAMDPGHDAYLQYCASCHGPDGEGNGPLAAELKKAPADLTRLSERFGSPLRAQELLERVDGRDMARAHGSREMPVWGRKLTSLAPPGAGTETQARGTMRIIIDWLASIQK